MIYVFINQRLFKVQGGIAKKCGCRDIGSLRHSCKVIHAIPVKKTKFIDNIYSEKSSYVYWYFLCSGQRVLISEGQMRKAFIYGGFSKEHRALVGKNIFIVEDVL